MCIPKNEYPRPQMMREDWLNLNGSWEFEFDFGKSGKYRNMLDKEKYDMEIIVPFCPESELSGIGFTDFINAVWYRRGFNIPSSWKNGRILLHFEAVDYYSEVWINNTLVGNHKGGYTPFYFDITEFLHENENKLTLYAEDDSRSGSQPSGKQSKIYPSTGCDYTRVTGIWQTVWLEYVPCSYIKSYTVTPDIENSRLHLSADLEGNATLYAEALWNGKKVGAGEAVSKGGSLNFQIELEELHLWEPLNPALYDLNITYGEDSIKGYFGMRSLSLTENEMLINGKPVFQRLVLDQGYYPDGIYTAPTDEALKRDIELSIAMGFNGARLHQKVFERRFLYHADKMGYLVWGEYGNWGLDHSGPEALGIFLPEWLEAVARDYNSPALIGWCPFNETWDIRGHRQDDAVLKGIYLASKAIDKTRPVIDTSGNYHVMTDIYDVHNYNQDVRQFQKDFEPVISGGDPFDHLSDRQKYAGQPYFVSEYGGIQWNEQKSDGWGYGNRPKSIEEYVERYIGLARTLLENPRIFGLCYTQLYDVEQEVNGIYHYDRTPKFRAEIMERLRAAMATPAAIEK